MADEWDRLASWRGRTLSATEILAEVDSTNSEALRRIEAGPEVEPRLLVARRQTAGHGSRGRPWHDVPGRSLAATAIMRWPEGLAPALATWTGALSVCDVLRELGLEPRVKWPNDVLVGGRKIAGILAETRFRDGALLVALGIGLNVGHAAGDFPAGLAHPATSLAMEGRSRSVGAIACDLALRLDWRLDESFARCSDRLRDDFLRELALRGRPVLATLSDRTIRGRLAGLGLDGSVVLLVTPAEPLGPRSRSPDETRIPGGHVLRLDEA